MMIAVEKHVSVLGVAIFQSLLLLGVYGFALALLLDVGLYRLSLYFCAAGIVGVALFSSPPLRVERPALATLGVGLVFLAQGWGVADAPIAGNFHRVLAWSMVAATAITLLPDRPGRWLSHRSAIAGLLVVFVAAQVTAILLRPKLPGLFPNIHHLALYSVVTVPVLYYLATRAKGVARWVFAAALAGDLFLLMKTQSRPGYLALLAASLVVVPFLAPRIRWLTLTATVLIPTALYFSGLFGFAARLDDLVVNFAKEERPLIWRETLSIQMRSSWSEWWFGHGLGQFYENYRAAPSYHYEDHYASPHNYLLELLYSHGLTGLILMIVAYILFYRKVVSRLFNSGDNDHRRVGVLIISIVTAQFVMGFFTVPFFSRHNLYPLVLIVGVGLRYISDTRRHA
ncbi:O-antigen ligase family protein [Methylomagnum sp.]